MSCPVPEPYVQSRALDGTGRLGYDSNDNGANKDSNDRDSHGIYWLADLLPNDIPNARILAWSYDSNYCDDGCSQVSCRYYFRHAQDILEDLCNARREPDVNVSPF